jgi:hypothetical protein
VAARAAEGEGLEGEEGGVGFCLKHSGIGGIALNNCVRGEGDEAKTITDSAYDIVKRARKAGLYVEYSSGYKGIHILGLSTGSEVYTSFTLPDGAVVEILRNTHRFLPVTAQQLYKQDWETDDSWGDIDALIDELIKGRPDSAGKSEEVAGPFANVAAYDFPDESTLERRDFLYGHHLLRETVSLTAALGGTGKSSKAIVEALAMTTGKALLGVQPAGCLRVLLINLEDNRKEMNRRIRAVMKFYGLRKADVGDRLFVIAKGEWRLRLALYRRGELTYGRTSKLVDFLKANKIDVLSVDPLRKTHRVRENDNGDMGFLIEVFEDIAEEASCAVHLWHHNRKSNSGETTIDSARGASALIDAPRSAEILETLPQETADKFNISSKQRRFYFRCYNGKVNFAPPVEESHWFELHNVRLSNGDDVAVVAAWKPPAPKDLLTPAAIDAIKLKVREGEWREDIRATLWVGKAIGEVLGLDPGEHRGILKQVLRTLIATKVLKTRSGFDQQRRPVLFVDVV